MCGVARGGGGATIPCSLPRRRLQTGVSVRRRSWSHTAKNGSDMATWIRFFPPAGTLVRFVHAPEPVCFVCARPVDLVSRKSHYGVGRRSAARPGGGTLDIDDHFRLGRDAHGQRQLVVLCSLIQSWQVDRRSVPAVSRGGCRP